MKFYMKNPERVRAKLVNRDGKLVYKVSNTLYEDSIVPRREFERKHSFVNSSEFIKNTEFVMAEPSTKDGVFGYNVMFDMYDDWNMLCFINKDNFESCYTKVDKHLVFISHLERLENPDRNPENADWYQHGLYAPFSFV